MPNHYEFVPRDGKKMTYEFHIGSGMGPQSSFSHSKERINFLLTERKTKNYSFVIEAVERSISIAADSYITAS